MKTHRTLALALGLPLLAACGESPTAGTPPACTVSPALAATAARLPEHSPYEALFESAGAEHDVPPALLRAIGHVETGWRMVAGEEEFHGQAPAFGVMALRGERLRRGAALAGLPEDEVRRAARANVLAAAALLRQHADSLGLDGDGLGAWAPAVAEFSGITLPAGREGYLRDVYAALGGYRVAPSFSAAHAALDPCGTAPPPPAAPTTDFAGALWRGSPNFNARMAGEGGVVRIVIVHSCEGAYTGCWSWLANPVSQVSAHYVVREDGAEITQLVRDAARAWHIGAVYDSTLNAGHAGFLHGVQSNHFTIGVEHAGYASQGSWPVEQIDASARLVCDVTRRWSIPRDRLRIVSHGQLQPHNRTDPGANWPWAEYLLRIRRHCGD